MTPRSNSLHTVATTKSMANNVFSQGPASHPKGPAHLGPDKGDLLVSSWHGSLLALARLVRMRIRLGTKNTNRLTLRGRWPVLPSRPWTVLKRFSRWNGRSKRVPMKHHNQMILHDGGYLSPRWCKYSRGANAVIFVSVSLCNNENATTTTEVSVLAKGWDLSPRKMSMMHHALFLCTMNRPVNAQIGCTKGFKNHAIPTKDNSDKV